jgi:hypothetical protein
MDKTHYDPKSNPHFEEAREHMKAAHEAFRKSYESMLPPGLVENRRKIKRELLMAMRSMLDAAIDHSEKTSTSE